MSSDRNTEGKRKPLPEQMRAFIDIAVVSPTDLLVIEENHNGATTDPLTDRGKKHQEADESYDGDGIFATCLGMSWLKSIFNIFTIGAHRSLLDLVQYDDMESQKSQFNRYFRTASPALINQWHQTRQAVDAAGKKAGKAPGADDFVDLLQARVQQEIAAAAIVMNGASRGGDQALDAKVKTDYERLTAFSLQTEGLKTGLAGRTEQEKQDMVKAACPDEWREYEEDNSFLSSRSPRRSADSKTGDEASFRQTLMQLFAMAGAAPVANVRPAVATLRNNLEFAPG